MEKTISITGKGPTVALRCAAAASSTLDIAMGKPKLDLKDMRRKAERATGLKERPDLDSTLFREGQECLVDSILSEARLSSLGLRLAKRDIQSWLESYLILQNQILDHPYPSEKQCFNKPLFIVGWARTGSTLLHRLLNQIETFRAPHFWELGDTPLNSKTLKKDSAYDQITKARQKLKFIQMLAPEALDIHPMQVDAPDECHFLLEPLFASPQYCLFYNIPSYWQWVRQLSDSQLEYEYRIYKDRAWRILGQDSELHWCSKTLIHMFFAPVLNRVFPDCRVIWLKREPSEAIASFCSLIHSYRRLYSNKVDPNEIGSLIADVYEQANDKISIAKQRIPNENCLVLNYSDLVANPIGEIENICNKFSYELTEQDIANIRRELDRCRKENSTKVHKYSLADYGFKDNDPLVEMIV